MPINIPATLRHAKALQAEQQRPKHRLTPSQEAKLTILATQFDEASSSQSDKIKTRAQVAFGVNLAHYVNNPRLALAEAGYDTI